ncbi:hypothetical protein AD953_06910 [Acetobacter malorum]|uniref:Antitoxin VbhA domain-containing protein n=1 Tax=Acetobacter malorum TaxID=178901 RepID=A0A149V5X1_9PROT|nr:antitoxin VbhA family protein [Acetobacter malorum]KXV75574.1 hypothetical protein AD953_06910 [Acetobacter malorum]
MLTPEQIAARTRAVHKARVNNLIEGLREDPRDAALLDAYARGEITSDEARRRVVASCREVRKKMRGEDE